MARKLAIHAAARAAGSKALHMEVASLFCKPSVLIIDRSAETREVLRTALTQRGTDVWEASRAEEGLALARKHHPDVIVLDLEIAQEANEAVCGEFYSRATVLAPIVLLGAAKRVAQSFPGGQFVTKPYHYAPLIRKIEALLDESQRPLTRSA